MTVPLRNLKFFQRAGQIPVASTPIAPMMANRVAYSFDKYRKVEESYKFTLPELYRKIAEEELHETDVVREQALTQMREWIVSNPHIRKCRVDAPFLLRFLRFRNFSVPMACEALEHYLTVREMFPSWFKTLDGNDPEMRHMQELSGFSVLGQDSAGRTLVLIECLPLEREQLTPLAIGRFIFMLLEALLELEEVQIGGVQVLENYTGISMDIFRGWGATELKIGFDGIARYYPIRYDSLHIAGAPKTVASFLEYMLTFAPPKFKEKINCHASADKFKAIIESSMKPTAYGGSVDLNELNSKFWGRFEKQYENFALALDQFEIDVDHYSAEWGKQNLDMVEAKAFKHLNID